VKGCETLRILVLGIYPYILIEESEPGIAIPEKITMEELGQKSNG
jgi:hypothetical protein